jgi:hypothetical protein
MSRLELSIFADYFQFYVEDDVQAPEPVDFKDGWTPEAVDRQLDAVAHAIAVGTSRNMTVPVTIEISSAPPEDDPSAELITESSLDVESGRLVILGCTDYAPDAVRLNVVPGRYRARVFYYDQEKLSADKLDGDDRYRVVLWPAPEVVAPRVLVDKRTLRPSQRAR